ncbi:hypothetical protein [Tenacibaculum xiamenense]|uniref:hypothetical protein n=1 Tax=Tenacibaculum xiamenense TaxID=1261553 RepID=UPI0038930420
MQFKNIIKFYLILLLCSCSKSNKNIYTNNYDNLIFKAENNILDKEYYKAENNFIEAFSDGRYFSTDINNALITSLKTKNWEKALFYSSKLVERGVGLSFFEKEVFNEFKNTIQWGKFLQKVDVLHEVYLKNIDRELIDSIKILREIDQSKYCLIPSGRVELKDAFKKTIFLDSLLNKLFINRGFPSEKLIGVSLKGDTIINYKPSYYSLLWHSYQANSSLMEKHLKNAVVNGTLKQDLFKHISEVNKIEYVVIDCKIYKSNFVENNSFQEEHIRKKIEEHTRKKIIYNNSNNKDGYIFHTPLAILKDLNINNLEGDSSEIFEYIIDYEKCEL